MNCFHLTAQQQQIKEENTEPWSTQRQQHILLTKNENNKERLVKFNWTEARCDVETQSSGHQK